MVFETLDLKKLSSLIKGIYFSAKKQTQKIKGKVEIVQSTLQMFYRSFKSC
jgi:hypothetical protein